MEELEHADVLKHGGGWVASTIHSASYNLSGRSLIRDLLSNAVSQKNEPKLTVNTFNASV